MKTQFELKLMKILRIAKRLRHVVCLLSIGSIRLIAADMSAKSILDSMTMVMQPISSQGKMEQEIITSNQRELSISKFKKPGPAISTLIILSLFIISPAKISATSLGFWPSNFPRTKARLLDISPKLFSFGISTEKSTFLAFSDNFPFELKTKIHFKSSSLIC